MSDDSVHHLNLVIDDLTNSIRHVDTGESFETDISLATSEDIKLVTKKSGWHFSWRAEFEQTDREVYKLTLAHEPEILQGLISLSDMDGYVYVHLAESAP